MTFTRNEPLHTVALLGIAMCFATTHAPGQHAGDVIFDIQDAEIVTGLADSDGTVTFPHYVWSVGLTQFDNFANDPGYDSTAGTFPQGAAVGISIRKALRVWNGDDEHFDDIADPETMIIEHLSIIIETPSDDPGSGDPLPSLHLATAGASGIIHVHPWYGLTEPHSPGVYLLELEAWVSAAGVNNSDPFWIVFNQDTPIDIAQDAVAWVEDNLVPSPCPADLTGSGIVDVFDLLEVIANWGSCDVCDDCPADITGSCEVDVFDLLEVIGNWGPCP